MLNGQQPASGIGWLPSWNPRPVGAQGVCPLSVQLPEGSLSSVNKIVSPHCLKLCHSSPWVSGPSPSSWWWGSWLVTTGPLLQPPVHPVPCERPPHPLDMDFIGRKRPRANGKLSIVYVQHKLLGYLILGSARYIETLFFQNSFVSCRKMLDRADFASSDHLAPVCNSCQPFSHSARV